jgi:anaerobic selenocysteine-containing dehydrogenase
MRAAAVKTAAAAKTATAAAMESATATATESAAAATAAPACGHREGDQAGSRDRRHSKGDPGHDFLHSTLEICAAPIRHTNWANAL